MATAEEILSAMAAEETQQVLVIDNDLRTITIPEGVTLLGVTSDEDVRRLHFAMPRMCGEVDLSAFALRINYLNAGNEGDRYPVSDAEVDGDTIRFTWLVGRHACKYKGNVRFIVCARLVGDGGEIEREFNTTLASLPVLEGLETGEAIVQAHPDVIESILKRLDTLEQEGGGISSDAIAEAVEAYIKANGVTVEETDPTVPDWAKRPGKPKYTASEVGALPDSYTPPVTSVNGKTGAVQLGAEDVGARPSTWTPSAGDVGADASGTAAAQVGAHNVSGEAHADMRALIEGLTSRLNALADSDDETLDQLSEIVAYIKSNKALIDAVTTGKVSTSDIVDNLTTNASGKVLSAAQGVALKGLIDAIIIPDKLPNPQPLTINGQSYDGSAAVSVDIQAGESGGSAYELPIASATQLGGVMPVAATEEMTQAVGVNAEGRLFTAAGAGGGETLTAEETLLASGTIAAGSSEDADTGISMTDLKAWKTFAIQILGVGSNQAIAVGEGNPWSWDSTILKSQQNAGQTKCLTAIFEWADSARSVLKPVHISGTSRGQNAGPGTSAIAKHVLADMYPPYWFPAAIVRYYKVGFSGNIYIMLDAANDTSDITWAIRGMIK